MGELGTRGTTERVPVGNSPPKVARAVFLPDGDAIQRPLVPRFRCSPHLMRGVDMTSDVKSWEQLFYVCLMFFPWSRLSEEPEPVRHDG